MTRETVGKIAVDLIQKTPDTRDPIELERELHTDYESNVFLCLESGKKEYPGDFFIVVITKKEPLLQNVLRHYFVHRKSCPTPDYDQTVYRYDKKQDKFEFVWVIPSKDTCCIFKNNALIINPEERVLLQFILDFDDGTLYKKSKKFNKERETIGCALQ